MQIEPPDCFVRVEVALAEVELLREEMGRPADHRPELHVTGAAPREVYFEALAFFRKADRLCFERTGEQAVLAHPPSADALQPAHVKTVIDAGIERLRQVKARLDVAQIVDEPGRDAAKVPSDVLDGLWRASRQLNLVLEQPFAPNDSYQLLTLAASYGSLLVGKKGAAQPALPDFERRKRPCDVYGRLWDCLNLVRETAGRWGQQMLDPGKLPYEPDEVTPSDVYDLGALLLSELAYLHAKTPGVAPPSAADLFEVGYKVPSHVYQLAGLIEAQLRALAA